MVFLRNISINTLMMLMTIIIIIITVNRISESVIMKKEHAC